MTWDTPVPIFEDEDEDELIRQFVELSAAYPNYSPITITNHIFANLKDPSMRASQAAIQWSNNLAIKIRIDEARLNGNKEPVELTKKQLQQKLLILAEDPNITATEKKARNDIYMSIARINGWEIKAGDAEDPDKKRGHFPQIVFAVAGQQQAA